MTTQIIPDGMILINYETPQLVLLNGYYFDPSIGEWFVQLDGEVIGYATTEPNARRQYNEALRIRNDHATRNPANVMPDAYAEPVINWQGVTI